MTLCVPSPSSLVLLKPHFPIPAYISPHFPFRGIIFPPLPLSPANAFSNIYGKSGDLFPSTEEHLKGFFSGKCVGRIFKRASTHFRFRTQHVFLRIIMRHSRHKKLSYANAWLWRPRAAPLSDVGWEGRKKSEVRKVMSRLTRYSRKHD